jgi:hypothetical protein
MKEVSMSRLMVVLLITAVLLAACGGSADSLTANAGNDFSVKMDEQPRFDGCASTGDITNYKWTIVSAPEDMSEDAGKVIREIEPDCAFTLDAQMGVDEIGVWEIQLEVQDAAGNTAVDILTVTVTE